MAVSLDTIKKMRSDLVEARASYYEGGSVVKYLEVLEAKFYELVGLVEDDIIAEAKEDCQSGSGDSGSGSGDSGSGSGTN